MAKLSEKSGKELVYLARATIINKLGRESVSPTLEEPVFQSEGGTFVTIKKRGALRGCIGNIEAVGTIADGVRKNAINAAFHDRRFSALTEDEVDEIHISVSILTPAQALFYTDAEDLCRQLRPGIDGVILQLGRASATFLPQVWEQLPETEQFLSQLSLKAGLGENAWKSDGVDISVYQVQSFSEEEV